MKNLINISLLFLAIFVVSGCYKEVNPNDENFTIKHSTPGILSMVNYGRDSNGSQFLISLKPLPHLNGKNVAFGIVENESLPLLQKIGASFTFMQKPLTKIVITNCFKYGMRK